MTDGADQTAGAQTAKQKIKPKNSHFHARTREPVAQSSWAHLRLHLRLPLTSNPATSTPPPTYIYVSHGIHPALCSAKVRKCMWAKVPFWREVFLFGLAIYTDFASECKCKCKWMCGYKYEFILLRQPSIIAIILQLGCTRTFQRARAIECEDVKIRLTLQLNGGIYFEKFFLKTKKKMIMMAR